MFWVYFLRCADGSYYTGHTDNIETRIGQYQAGKCDGYTATRRPVELAWSQECVTRQDALSAELQIKGWSRKKKEAMRGDWMEVSRLAKSKSAHPSTGSGFDRLSRNRFCMVIKSISYDLLALRNAIQNWTKQNRNVLPQAQDERDWGCPVSCQRLSACGRISYSGRTDLPILQREVES